MTEVRAAGIALTVLGMALFAGPGLLVFWMRQMYTTGLSAGGFAVLAGLALIGIAAVASGIALIRKSATE